LTGALRRLARAPLATLLGVLVIGMTLALTAGLYLVVHNINGLTSRLNAEPQINIFLALDASDADVQALQSQLKTNPAVAENGAPKVDRLVALAVGNHLEKSQILLIELMTERAEDKTDFSATQDQARDLLDANRLYRISAARGKDPSVQHTLDDLERVLVEIANSPSDLKAGDVERLQKMVESQGLLFKVRVVGSRIRQQNNPPPAKQLGTKL